MEAAFFKRARVWSALGTRDSIRLWVGRGGAMDAVFLTHFRFRAGGNFRARWMSVLVFSARGGQGA